MSAGASAGKGAKVSAGAGAGSGAGAGAGSGAGASARAKAAAAANDAAAPSPRDAIGGWLLGPQVEQGQDEWSYKGERLGLPESGAGSLAGQGRRLGALFVDWGLSLLAVAAFGGHATSGQGRWEVILIFTVQVMVLESLLGYTIGKRVFRIQVGRLGGALTPPYVILRTLLLLLLIPPLVWDRDGRGLHDRLAGTVVINR